MFKSIAVNKYSHKGHLLQSVALSFVLFFYIYSCSLIFLGLPANFTSQRIIIFLLLFLLPFNQNKIKEFGSKTKTFANKGFRSYLFVVLLLLIYSLMLYIGIGPGNGMHIVVVLINTLFLGFVGGWLLVYYFNSFEQFITVLFIVSLIQCIIVWICTIDPQIGLLVDQAFGQEEYFQEARRGYAGGISCITAQGSIKLSLGLLATLYCMATRERKFWYFVAYFFIGLTASMVARTGLLFAISGLIVYFFLFSRSNGIKGFASALFIFVLLLIVLYWIIVVLYPSFFETVFSRMLFLFDVGVDEAFLDGYRNSDTTYYPSLREGFWGTGIVSGISENGIRVNVDGGPRRLYSAVGIPCSILFYVSFIAILIRIFKKTNKKQYKFFLLVFAVFLIIADFKEGSILNNYTIGVYFLSSILMQHEERKESSYTLYSA